MIATTRIVAWPLGLMLLLSIATARPSEAQTIPPAPLPSLPDSTALPAAANARLPGIDPRLCGTSRYAALCSNGRWAQFARLKLTATTPGFEGHYTIEQAASGEVHVTYRESAGKLRRGGEAMVVSEDSFAYRSRDKFEDPQGILEHIMASPIHLSQLTAVLLDQAVLGPPTSVDRPETVEARGATQFIRSESAYTTTLYGPAWQVNGTVRALAPLQIEFKLRFRYKPVDPSGKVLATSTTIDLAGTASYTELPKAMNASIDLVGWKLMKNATPMPEVATLREAREAVAAQ